MPILKLKPACTDYLWGGTKLREEYNIQSDLTPLAEAWALSCHKAGPSMIENGPDANLTLPQYIAKHGKSILGKNCERFDDFPILTKFIDAKGDLSIQVHPDNAYAQAHENQFGKTEMWYVLEAEPNSYLYYGFDHTITKEEYRERIQNNTLTEVLNAVPVHKGDVFFIPAGTLHAICKGVVIAEIQQNSNVTYRVYDYGRVGADGNPRQLHVSQALDVTECRPPRKDWNFGGHLARCEYFTADVIHGKGQGTCDTSSFVSFLVTDGQGILQCSDEEMSIRKGDSLFLPAGSGTWTLDGDATVLISWISPENYNETEKYRIGIDLGGTNIKVGIVDNENHIIAKNSCPTQGQRPWHEVADDIVRLACQLLEENRLDPKNCRGAGLACPGTIDRKTGLVIYSNNLSGWTNIPLADYISKALGFPVQISNDANCATLGECVAGAGKGCSYAVMLTLGTGVGGGVIWDGKVFEGGPGGVEPGHCLLLSGGEPCTCGRRGCVESYCSATALIRDAVRAAQANPNSLLNTLCEGDLSHMNGKIPFDAAKAGDPAGRKVVDCYLQNLGDAIVDMVTIFRPEIVLLGGGICNQGETLTVPLTQYVQDHAFAGHHLKTPPVYIATLGNDAGIIGAACLIS